MRKKAHIGADDPRVTRAIFTLRETAAYLAENLSRQVKPLGLTQEDLTSRAEIHRTQVGLLLNEKRTPRLDTLIKLAGALEIDPAELTKGMR